MTKKLKVGQKVLVHSWYAIAVWGIGYALGEIISLPDEHDHGYSIRYFHPDNNISPRRCRVSEGRLVPIPNNATKEQIEVLVAILNNK